MGGGRLIRAGGIALFCLATAGSQIPMARGVVFDDANQNGRRDPGEKGIANVKVSNQHQIVRTDSQGRWSLPVSDDTTFFVIKPRGWMTPVSDKMLPQFYYTHKPKGSPQVKFGGVAPTGPLPGSIDFALHKQNEPKRFRTLIFGDTQTRDVREIDYMMRDVVEPLIGYKDAAFGMTLGDLVFDDLSVLDPYIGALAMIGIPWYNVLGNHDINYDVLTDKLSDETFERHFGPNYYSFDYGPTHFVVLDNVHWYQDQAAGRGRYKGAFGEDQLKWLERDLAEVPKNQLVVLTMHIPLYDCEDKAAIYKLLNTRPYALSMAAHTHYQEHRFITAPELDKPHHHVVNVTVCGSWWQGRPDDQGVPVTTMRDGAPNGYSIFTFDGNQYSIEYRAARSNPNHQMSLYLPETLPSGETTELVVNVFGGSEKSTVECRVGNGPWQKMTHTKMKDPEFAAAAARDKDLKLPLRPLPEAMDSPHIWKAALPRFTERGTVPVQVRTKDMFGQVYEATRGIRIL